MVRSNLHELIFIDIFEHFLERHLDWRREDNLLVTAGRTDVRQLLGLADIDIQVAVTGMLTHNFSHIYFLSRINEELASVQKFVHRICYGLASFQ